MAHHAAGHSSDRLTSRHYCGSMKPSTISNPRRRGLSAPRRCTSSESPLISSTNLSTRSCRCSTAATLGQIHGSCISFGHFNANPRPRVLDEPSQKKNAEYLKLKRVRVLPAQETMTPREHELLRACDIRHIQHQLSRRQSGDCPHLVSEKEQLSRRTKPGAEHGPTLWSGNGQNQSSPHGTEPAIRAGSPMPEERRRSRQSNQMMRLVLTLWFRSPRVPPWSRRGKPRYTGAGRWP